MAPGTPSGTALPPNRGYLRTQHARSNRGLPQTPPQVDRALEQAGRPPGVLVFRETVHYLKHLAPGSRLTDDKRRSSVPPISLLRPNPQRRSEERRVGKE